MSRPIKKIDENLISELAGLNCSAEEIARIVGISKTTLYRSYGTLLKKGKKFVKTSLKRKQYEVAMKGNPALLIWLGKIILKQTDKTKIDSKVKLKIIREVTEDLNGSE